MASGPAPVIIASCGPGASELVSPVVWLAAEACDVLIGAQRLLGLFPTSGAERLGEPVRPEALVDLVAARHERGQRVTVLLSGDALTHSHMPLLVKRLGRSRCHVIPGVSAPAMALARLGLDNSNLVILNGRLTEMFPTVEALEAVEKIALLVDGDEGWAFAVKLSTELEVTHATLLFERLSMPGEKIRRLPPATMVTINPPALVMALLLKRGNLRDAIDSSDNR